MKSLPLELKQEIVLYLDFLKCDSLFPEISHYIYTEPYDLHDWGIRNGFPRKFYTNNGLTRNGFRKF